MEICVLASGSKGNSTYIGTNQTKLLIDLGTSSNYVEQQLKAIEVNPRQIKAILLTHTHNDHIKGLKVFLKKYNPTLFLSPIMYQDISKLFKITNYCLIEDDMMIDDLAISIIKLSHDASDSNGYIISHDHKSIAYITDTGYINKRYYNQLRNKEAYFMESNYDVKRLMEGSYPYYLKQRILSDSGHLSNADASKYLSLLIGDKTKTIVLIHLSEENNTKALALTTLKRKLTVAKKPSIIISGQHDKTRVIKI